MRSLRSNKGMEVNCLKCQEPHTDQMVQCDQCDQCDHWFHYSCVGVDNNVNDIDWSCDTCALIKEPLAITKAASATSTTDMLRNGVTTNVTTVSLATSFSTAATCVTSYKPQSSVMAEIESVKRFLPTTTTALKATVSSTPFSTAATYATPLETLSGVTSVFGNIGNSLPTNTTILQTVPSNQACNNNTTNFTMPKPHLPLNVGTFWSNTTEEIKEARQIDSNSVQQRRQQMEFELLEEENKIKTEYLQRKYQILSQMTDVNSIASLHSFGPTPAQLAARQVLPKGLPEFNGDPEDWPLFISAFENSTSMGGFTDAENLMRLQTSLKGKAKEIVKSKLFIPSLVPDIIATLKMCFGRPEIIIDRMIKKAKQLPAPQDKLETLIDFALAVKNITSTIKACQLNDYLNNPMLVKEFVDKLPSHYKLTWAMQPASNQPTVLAFSDWLFGLAEAASKVVSLTTSKKGSVNVHTEENNDKTSCVVCKKDHKLPKCSEFEKLTVDHKWEIVKKNKLCRICLRNHRRKCYVDRECGVNGCKAKHHPTLHNSERQQPQKQDTHVSADVNTHNATDKTLFRIIPIKISAKGKIIDTFAFLDEGSSVTLIEETLFQQTGITGFPTPLHLRWTGNTTREEEKSVSATIQIINAHNGKNYTLKGVRTVRNLGLPRQTLDMESIIPSFPYLKGVPIRSYTNAKPLVLIGADNWNLAVPLQVKEGRYHQPIATKTRLGWTVQGGGNVRENRQHLNIHMCDCQQQNDELHELVKNYFTLESTSKTVRSEEEEQALGILRSTCKKLKPNYEVGLTWRNPDIRLPESYRTAHRRLICLQNKFKRDTNLQTKMQDEIDNLIRKNYARKLQPEELTTNNDHTWYLPIFVTFNPNKPKRARLVWDASAKSHGKCLNDFLLSGPDLLTPLVNILLSFRVGQVAICGDIAEMFHQIRIRPQDMHAQRFLWCSSDGDPHNPDVYVMEALTFGTSCAPFIAHFIRNTNADKFKQQYPKAAAAITQSHYVDDFIDSVDSTEEALQLAKDVRTVHSAAGFHIRNWVSNCCEIAKELNNNDEAKQQEVHKLSPTEKILGMYWDYNTDRFKYIFRFARLKRDVLAPEAVPTKREVLQVLMSVYDPLGFILCYTVQLKILLQNVWRSELGWDDTLSDDLLKRWKQWKKTLQEISNVEIPRCFSKLLTQRTIRVQQHTFVDAGEDAYSAVCYLRIESDNDVDVSLVAAKAKVSPLKPVTIPRLELQAAVMGMRLSQVVCSISRIPINENIWWTETKTVLKWLRMDPRRLNHFVMFRVGEILENSNAKEWKWVPSKLNPADLATKIVTHGNLEQWFNGPEFLKSNPENWPKCDDIGLEADIELRNHHLHIQLAPPTQPQFDVEYFSDWWRLCRAVRNCMRYFDLVRNRCNATPMRSLFQRSSQAKNLLYLQAQRSAYATEIDNLTRGKPIKNSSKLIGIDPYLDCNGNLRMRSRVQLTTNTEDAVILPKNHHITFLIVRSYHEKFHHQLHEAIVNEIRIKYFIPKLRVLYKTVRSKCNKCKTLLAKPREQQMAVLPKARLATFQRPFTCTGIDFFGPFTVSIGRRQEKRWGVIFTCLTIRAIHIEVASSLDTTSCVVCIGNFIARRGTPRQIYTDNGTNFKGTERLLREHYLNLDYPTIVNKLDEIEWIFNPPAAPHMGGAWERLIRTIKAVLKVICPSTTFTDESLRHALCEVEFTINSRPLTFVALDAANDEALTPNHFLLGSSSGIKPFCTHNHDLRESWKKANEFADIFRNKWIKEYAPTIARRGKWFRKQTPLKKGDIVIITDENLPRNCWPKGIIEEVISSKDGQVRRAKVRSQNGTLERPASKLAPLDIGNESV